MNVANLPKSLDHHRMQSTAMQSVVRGHVRYSPVKSLWFIAMSLGTVGGVVAMFTWWAFATFLVSTATVLLFGHSLGSHRKLIHDSYQCPRWLEYVLVYLGVQVGLAGPIGLLRQHELRDYAQRMPDCHPYLRHGSSFWRDAWWQLNCDLVLDAEPVIRIEPRIADDRVYRFLERTWMWQQLPPALMLYAIGGWSFVLWGSCARVTAGVLGHWLIGYFAHNKGGMHYEVHGAAVQGRNIRFTALLTMGESWHNNHHAFPGSARLGLFAGEWDPGWWALMAMRKIGLVWAIRLPADMAPRPELIALDAAERDAADTDSLATEPDGGWILSAPAANVPAAWLRWLAGDVAAFERDTGSRRLALHIGDRVVHGLPAICAVLKRRGGFAAGLSFFALPLAIGFENLRECFDVE